MTDDHLKGILSQRVLEDEESKRRRQEADLFKEKVTRPLRDARDHCHWHNVHRRRMTARWLEQILEVAVRMAYAFEGILARGEEGQLPSGEVRLHRAGD